MSRLSALLAIFIASTPFHPSAAQEVVVFAAASLKDALDSLGDRFAMQSGNEVRISYAGSGVLARQIIEGAPADVYISANSQWMDEVGAAGLIAPGARLDLLGNTMVLIGAPEAAPVTLGPDTDFPALLAGGKLAMGLVDSVPAGQYGKAALENLGLWDQLAPDVAQADNVRAALRLVSTGEAPLGIVYASDTKAVSNVTILATFPEDSHPPIVYPAALLSDAEGEAARAFYDYLTTSEAATIFEQYGFSMISNADD